MTARRQPRLLATVGRLGVVLALALLIGFGALRYDNFLSPYNVLTFLRYNSMFALVSLGMTFVILCGGIDLSVGAVAALGSVAAAMASDCGWAAGLAAGTVVGTGIGLANGLIVTRLGMAPFITTLATMLAARGTALLLAHNQSVPVSYETLFTGIGQEDFLGFPIPAWIALAGFLLGMLLLNLSAFGRGVLAIGGNEDAARMMGLPVNRLKLIVYTASGALAGLAGVILAAQFGAGQPVEGVGWELFAISAVVVGGTLLTGGQGSVATTLAGVLLLGMIFNLLNFENGRGWISLSAYWQSVIRGLILLAVVLLQARLAQHARVRLTG